MALNIKDDSVHEAVKRIAQITGESQAQAVALDTREPLLRKGDDFGHTGIASALKR